MWLASSEDGQSLDRCSVSEICPFILFRGLDWETGQVCLHGLYNLESWCILILSDSWQNSLGGGKWPNGSNWGGFLGWFCCTTSSPHPHDPSVEGQRCIFIGSTGWPLEDVPLVSGMETGGGIWDGRTRFQGTKSIHIIPQKIPVETTQHGGWSHLGYLSKWILLYKSWLYCA